MEGVQERCRILLPAWCHHPCCRAVASLQTPGNDRSFFWASGGGVRTPIMGTTLSFWCHGWHLALQLQRRRRAQHGHNQKVLGCSLHLPPDTSMVTSPSQTENKKTKKQGEMQAADTAHQRCLAEPARLSSINNDCHTNCKLGPQEGWHPSLLGPGETCRGNFCPRSDRGEEPGGKISALGTRSGA